MRSPPLFFLSLLPLLLFACERGGAVPRDVAVGEATAAPVSLFAGDTVTVRLRVNMSSGSIWRLVAAPAATVAFLGDELLPLEDEPRLPGTVGQAEVQVFRFKAISAGEAELEFTKCRPWEKRAPEKRLRVVLAVSQP